MEVPILGKFVGLASPLEGVECQQLDSGVMMDCTKTNRALVGTGPTSGHITRDVLVPLVVVVTLYAGELYVVVVMRIPKVLAMASFHSQIPSTRIGTRTVTTDFEPYLRGRRRMVRVFVVVVVVMKKWVMMKRFGWYSSSSSSK